jgi:hypothetical protein
MENEPEERTSKLRVPLPFEDAIAAALETPPEPDEDKPGSFGKRKQDDDRSGRYDES